MQKQISFNSIIFSSKKWKTFLVHSLTNLNRSETPTKILWDERGFVSSSLQWLICSLISVCLFSLRMNSATSCFFHHHFFWFFTFLFVIIFFWSVLFFVTCFLTLALLLATFDFVEHCVPHAIVFFLFSLFFFFWFVFFLLLIFKIRKKLMRLSVVSWF